MPRTPSKPTTKALTPQKPVQVAIAPSLIVVEGNISAGKTTLCEKLGYEMESTKVFKEPVSTNPYLTKFYAEPKKYALIMQLWLLRQRFETYLEAMRHVAETGESVVLDRSLFSDWVFAEKNRLGTERCSALLRCSVSEPIRLWQCVASVLRCSWVPSSPLAQPRRL